MKNDDFAAGRRFLAWMESRYPGSAAKILTRSNIPVASAKLAGLGPNNGLGQWADPLSAPWSGIPPLPTAGGAPNWSGQATLQPAAVPKEEPAWWEKLASTAGDIAKGYLSYKQQDKITDMQVERMKRGMPPIEDPGRYMAPTVKIAHEVDPQQLRDVITPSKETQNMLLLGGGILAAVLAFAFFNR